MLARVSSVRGSRRLIAFSATGALVGIALSVIQSPAGPAVVVASLLLLLVGLHRYGRTGADRASRRRARSRRSRPTRQPS